MGIFYEVDRIRRVIAVPVMKTDKNIKISGSQVPRKLANISNDPKMASATTKKSMNKANIVKTTAVVSGLV